MKVKRTTLGAAVMVAAIGMSGCSSEAPRPAPTQQPERPEQTTESGYRDGVYSATGWYGGLPSHHDVTLTIEQDVVTAVEITTPAEDPTSLGYQQRFAEALPQEVIGRNIDELAVDRLAGSSGCSEGFMDALAQIKAQATEGTP